MTMTLVKLRYNSKLVLDPGLVLQTPLCVRQLSRVEKILKCVNIEKISQLTTLNKKKILIINRKI